MPHEPTRKPFKVAAVSSNLNSFGLCGMILIADDGEAWQVGANHLYVRRVGDVVHVPLAGDRCEFSGLGFEIPERLPEAPPGVVEEAWRLKMPNRG